MKTSLFLVRHGETVDNVNQIMQGQTQGELNEVGVRQACELRDRLASEPVDAIVASDLWRSVRTARILSEPHGLEVDSTPLLRERDWGSFTGRFIPDLKDEVWPPAVYQASLYGETGGGCGSRHHQQGDTGRPLWQADASGREDGELRGKNTGTIN